MESLRELFKIGSGPSSSHTIAPQRATKLFLNKFSGITRLHVELYGSLSLTGKGHFTDHAIIMTAGDIPCTVDFRSEAWEYDFPNGMIIYGYRPCESENTEGAAIAREAEVSNEDSEATFDIYCQDVVSWVVYSLGGGSIKVLGEDFDFQKNVYPHSSIEKIESYCHRKKWGFDDYVFSIEPDLGEYLQTILQAMINSVERGLSAEGYLLGAMRIKRSAKKMHESLSNLADGFSESVLRTRRLSTYAYAVMEENASLGAVVTAPTCGSSGVLAACMYYYHHDRKYSSDRLVKALAVAGLFGNIVKTNATISGAEGGCQAEVGVGCAMSAAAVAYLEGSDMDTIEYAAEIAMEHHLGLTCDPISGYVIIPCIERNAVATVRAFESAHMARFFLEHRKSIITFDMVVETMKYTGARIAVELRETSLGGLATAFSLKRETHYYNNGVIRATGMVDSSGRKQNQWVHYRRTGHLWQVGYYKDDIKNGPYVKIKAGGDIDSVEFFKMGKLSKISILKQAVIHAFKMHDGQTRKGGSVPYILHPLEALGIAFAIAPDNEYALVAAVLHDVLEETEETKESLTKLFGAAADIVAEETEDKSLSWEVRKQNAVDYFNSKKPSPEARIVALADKLSNFRAISEDYAKLGNELWERFTEKDPKKQKAYYRGMCDALATLGDRGAWKELNSLIDALIV